MSPAVAGDTVFVGSCSGSFYALESESGEVIWSYNANDNESRAQFHGDPLITESLVVAGADGHPHAHLYAFDRRSGTIRWKRKFPGGVATTVLRHEDTALAVTLAGIVASIELETGNIRWQAPGPREAQDTYSGDAVLADGRLFVPWRPGVIDAFDAATGTLVWRARVDGVLNTSATLLQDRVVVVGTADGRVLALDTDTGRLVKSFYPGPRNAILYGRLATGPGCLLTLQAKSGTNDLIELEGPFWLICIDPSLHRVRWRHRGEKEFSTPQPLVWKRRVIAGSEGRLLALSIEDGTLLWNREMDLVPRGLGSSAEHLLVGTRAGKLLAFPKDRPISLSRSEPRACTP